VDTPRPSPRTNRTRRVPHRVLTGHAASLSQVALPDQGGLLLFGGQARAPRSARARAPRPALRTRGAWRGAQGRAEARAAGGACRWARPSSTTAAGCSLRVRASGVRRVPRPRAACAARRSGLCPRAAPMFERSPAVRAQPYPGPRAEAGRAGRGGAAPTRGTHSHGAAGQGVPVWRAQRHPLLPGAHGPLLLPRTNRTSLVPPLVLSGRAASLTPYALGPSRVAPGPAGRWQARVHALAAVWP